MQGPEGCSFQILESETYSQRVLQTGGSHSFKTDVLIARFGKNNSECLESLSPSSSLSVRTADEEGYFHSQDNNFKRERQKDENDRENGDLR